MLIALTWPDACVCVSGMLFGLTGLISLFIWLEGRATARMIERHAMREKEERPS